MINCPECGTQINDENAKICPTCGTRIDGYKTYSLYEGKTTSTIVLGIVGIVLSLIAIGVVPILFGGGGIACGIIGTVKASKYKNGILNGIADPLGRGKANAGFVLSIIAIILGIICLIVGTYLGAKTGVQQYSNY